MKIFFWQWRDTVENEEAGGRINPSLNCQGSRLCDTIKGGNGGNLEKDTSGLGWQHDDIYILYIHITIYN
jgi:hypothetical protein